MTSEYDQLISKYKDVAVASSISSTLYWDRETGKLPDQGIPHRATQMSYLKRQQERFWRSNETANLLSKLNKVSLDKVKQRNVDLISRTQKVKTQVPEELIINLVTQSNSTNAKWKKAKAQVDFSIVQDELETLFNLNRDYARKLADIKGFDDPFDALIDKRDEGLTSKSITPYFEEARNFLVPFIKDNIKEPTQLAMNIRNMSMTKQEERLMIEFIADLFGYPYQGEEARGNIDEVEHPLTITCGPDDVRVTVKHGHYLNVIDSMNHELGHALHHLGKNQKWNYQPINSGTGPSIGECLSRFTENKIGKTFEFMMNTHPELNEISNYKLNEISIDEFYDAATMISPGPIRTSADEVSYGLHIIIRFEIEKLLFNDKATITELPQLWNQKYEDYLGVEVLNDTQGVLQDLHWYTTYWGYFHGYFMGDLMGSQIYFSMIENLDDFHGDLAEGNLSNALHWLKSKIYQQGALYPALDLVEHVTGSPLDVEYFKQYIRQKFD